MEDTRLPNYAVFDDYQYSQRIAVTVRWFLQNMRQRAEELGGSFKSSLPQKGTTVTGELPTEGL